MAALKDHNAPETKVCNACGLPRAREAYGTKQWKARSVRRCTECVTADRPVRAKVPVPAPAPAPARRSAPLTPEEKESASRLSDGAPLTYKIRAAHECASPWSPLREMFATSDLICAIVPQLAFFRSSSVRGLTWPQPNTTDCGLQGEAKRLPRSRHEILLSV